MSCSRTSQVETGDGGTTIGAHVTPTPASNIRPHKRTDDSHAPPPVTSAPTSAATTLPPPLQVHQRGARQRCRITATKDPQLGPGKLARLLLLSRTVPPPQTSADQCTEAPSGQKYIGQSRRPTTLLSARLDQVQDGSACDLKADAQAEAETVAAAAVRDKQGPDAGGWMMHFDKMASALLKRKSPSASAGEPSLSC